MDFFDLETIPGMMSSKECCETIQEMSNNLAKDQTSTLINNGRAATLKMLIKLFLEYNKIMKEYNDANRKGIT